MTNFNDRIDAGIKELDKIAKERLSSIVENNMRMKLSDFRSVLLAMKEPEPAKHEHQLQPLDEKLVRNALEAKHGLTDHQSMLLWHTISEFGTPKQQEVSVEEIKTIIEKHEKITVVHCKYSLNSRELAQIIHDRIYGKRN